MAISKEAAMVAVVNRTGSREAEATKVKRDMKAVTITTNAVKARVMPSMNREDQN